VVSLSSPASRRTATVTRMDRVCQSQFQGNHTNVWATT
jgi:hypothetical protein